MQLKVSNKYQVIIPKAARKKMNLERGQTYMTVKHVTNNEITFVKSPKQPSSGIEKYAGTLKNTAWQKAGMDAAEWIRKMRDEEWDQ